MGKILIGIVIFLVLGLVGLVVFAMFGTDGKMAKWKSYGESRSIECYSGGSLIYKGESTGKIQSERSSDGYYFKEKGSGKLLEVSGNCVIGK